MLGFHKRWNKKLYRRHSSLWSFITQLKDEQRLTVVTTRAAERGDAQPEVKSKWRVLEKSICRLKRRYRHWDHSVNKYWDAVQRSLKNYL